MRANGLLLAAILAGCIGAADPDAPPTTATPILDVLPAPLVAEAPRHGIGTAWTFSGTQLYNPDAEFTVVVARASGAGYLFAGGDEDDLVHDALWGNTWYGPRDDHLNRKDWGPRFLDFPLFDGKTWKLDEERTLTAALADVATPFGTERGFVVTAERVSFDYAPSLGMITRWQYDYARGPGESVRLVRVASDQPWVWHEIGPIVAIGDPGVPNVIDVPDGYDDLLVSVGGTAGARAVVAAPDGTTWTATFEGGEQWQQTRMATGAQRWTATIVSRPDAANDAPLGWAYMHVAPVRWLR